MHWGGGIIFSLVPCNFPVFSGQDTGTLFKKLRKAARRSIADHLGDLPHGKVGVDEKVLRLTHAAALNILRDRAALPALEAAMRSSCPPPENVPRAILTG